MRRRPGGSFPRPPTPPESDVQLSEFTSEQRILDVAGVVSGDTSGDISCDVTMLSEEPGPFLIPDDTVMAHFPANELLESLDFLIIP